MQAGKLGVDLSCQTANLRNQTQLEPTALKNVYGRNCMEIGGVWIDEGFDAKMTTLTVKAQSDAYFKLLDRDAKIKDVLAARQPPRVGDAERHGPDHRTPAGKEELSDEEIDELFAKK